MMWVAIVAFWSVAECDAFVEANNLQALWDQQCTLIDGGGLAPLTSPRPQPKPSRVEDERG